MYTNLTLYYLNQMGITPWIKKERVTSLDSTETCKLKLAVIVFSELSSKAQMLFHRMMSYINVQQDEFLLINAMQTNSVNEINAPGFSLVEDKKPCAILVFGQKVGNFNYNYPVLQSLELEHLLSNPILKKKVFQDLHFLMNIIN